MGAAFALAVGFALTLAAGVMGSRVAAGWGPAATVRYVAPAGNCGGASPCYAAIQAAVDAAAAGDEIRVAAGTYTGVTTRAGIKQVVFLDKKATVRGGFTTANWNTPNPSANLTTIDAQGLGRGLVISGTVTTAPAATVEGLRITGGDATGLGGYGGATLAAGGGVYVFLAQATFHNCAITNNTASTAAAGYGGGLAALFSTLTLDGCTVENNRASGGGNGNGGGVLVKNYPGGGGPVVLSGNTIRNNTASTAGGGWGGGVHLDTAAASLSGNTLAGNTATTAAGAAGYGGGLRADGSELTFTDNTVQDNRASAAGWGSGGGVFLRDTHATVTGNRLTGNTAATATTGDGGGFYAVSDLNIRTATVTLTDNTVQGNAACGNTAPIMALCRGGGVELWRVKATLTGNTIQGNIGGATTTGSTYVNNNSRGGGISLNEPFDTTLANNTISDNAANKTGYGYGGGIEISAQTPRGTVTLAGNTVQGNTGSQGFTGLGGGIFASGVTAVLSNNVLAANTASKGKYGFGGGFYADSGVLTLRDNTIQNNVASTADQGVGGGLSFDHVTLSVRAAATLTGNTVTGNTGSTAAANTSGWKSGAGGLELFGADATISGNTFRGNTGATAQAGYCGGVALYADVYSGGPSVSFTGNTIQDNIAGTAAAGGGGGGLCASGKVTASQNTLRGNTAATVGGGSGGGATIGLGLRAADLSGPTVFSGNTVQGNIASVSGAGRGGGLYVARNTMNSTDVFTVTHNLIADNLGSQGGAGTGGGIYLGPSYAARLDANTVVGNIAAKNAGMTGVGGGLAIASSNAFSVTNSVIAHNRADTAGSGVWLGKTGSMSEPLTWGRFLHTTVADNLVGAGVWLESPLAAGALTEAYASGTQLKVSTPCFYRVGDMLLILHTNGTTRAWRKLAAVQYGDAWRLTLDSPLPYAFPIGSVVRDASALFVDTIIAGHTVGLGAVDQPVTLVSTLWYSNSVYVTDNLNAIQSQGDVSGSPAFANAAGNDYHLTAGSAARDAGVNAGLTTDLDGEPRPYGPGYDIGADEYTGQVARTPTPTATATPARTATPTATVTATRSATATPTGTPGGRRIYLPLVLKR